MVRRAAYPPGEGDELVANGRTAQGVADAEKQRGAEESHGMPFLSIASWGGSWVAEWVGAAPDCPSASTTGGNVRGAATFRGTRPPTSLPVAAYHDTG